MDDRGAYYRQQGTQSKILFFHPHWLSKGKSLAGSVEIAPLGTHVAYVEMAPSEESGTLVIRSLDPMRDYEKVPIK